MINKVLVVDDSQPDRESLKKIVAQQQFEINALKSLFTKSLNPDGSVSVNSQVIINAKGEWVGSSTNLVGAKGSPGERGPKGDQGPKGNRGDPAIGYSVLPQSCSWTDYVNDWDNTYNYSCPDGKVLVGVGSKHDNRKEDRRFRFQCCRLKVSR